MKATELILLRSVLISSSLLVILFFLHLVIINSIDRRGVEAYSSLNKEVEAFRSEISDLDLEIAKYSALERVEKRASELGFSSAEKIEYIR